MKNLLDFSYSPAQHGVAINTRFNPTANGPIHLGHLYVALVNECEAHRAGGKFTLRFDDNQTFWKLRGTDTSTICQGILDDLKWCGIIPDVVTYQSKLQEKTNAVLRQLGYSKRGTLRFSFTPVYLPATKQKTRLYPYVPDYTAEKVVQDALDDIVLVIRGDDLVSEFALYNYFCDLWDFPVPSQVFLPRLAVGNTAVSVVSKTVGNCRICDYREKGYTPEQVLTMLRQACLIDANGQWTIENIKTNPMLDVPEEPIITSYGIRGLKSSPAPLIVSG